MRKTCIVFLRNPMNIYVDFLALKVHEEKHEERAVFAIFVPMA